MTVAEVVGGLTERVSNIVGLGELDEYSGDLDGASSGTYRINEPSKCTNLPNTTNIAWILLSSVGNTPTQPYLFGFQLIIGYSPTEVYIRYIWSSWSSWIRLDNV